MHAVSMRQPTVSPCEQILVALSEVARVAWLWCQTLGWPLASPSTDRATYLWYATARQSSAQGLASPQTQEPLQDMPVVYAATGVRACVH